MQVSKRVTRAISLVPPIPVYDQHADELYSSLNTDLLYLLGHVEQLEPLVPWALPLLDHAVSPLHLRQPQQAVHALSHLGVHMRCSVSAQLQHALIGSQARCMHSAIAIAIALEPTHLVVALRLCHGIGTDAPPLARLSAHCHRLLQRARRRRIVTLRLVPIRLQDGYVVLRTTGLQSVVAFRPHLIRLKALGAWPGWVKPSRLPTRILLGRVLT